MKKVPNTPVVAENRVKWPVVAPTAPGNRPAIAPNPVLAEARKKNKTRRTARQIQAAMAKRTGIKPPPSKKGKARKRITKAGVRRKSRKGGVGTTPTYITRTPVESSNVASIGYDDKNQILEVEFYSDKGSNSVYHYFDVDQDIYESFRSAPSKGRFVWRTLRGFGADNVYVYERVE